MNDANKYVVATTYWAYYRAIVHIVYLAYLLAHPHAVRHFNGVKMVFLARYM